MRPTIFRQAQLPIPISVLPIGETIVRLARDELHELGRRHQVLLRVRRRPAWLCFVHACQAEECGSQVGRSAMRHRQCYSIRLLRRSATPASPAPKSLIVWIPRCQITLS